MEYQKLYSPEDVCTMYYQRRRETRLGTEHLIQSYRRFQNISTITIVSSETMINAMSDE